MKCPGILKLLPKILQKYNMGIICACMQTLVEFFSFQFTKCTQLIQLGNLLINLLRSLDDNLNIIFSKDKSKKLSVLMNNTDIFSTLDAGFGILV